MGEIAWAGANTKNHCIVWSQLDHSGEMVQLADIFGGTNDIASCCFQCLVTGCDDAEISAEISIVLDLR